MTSTGNIKMSAMANPLHVQFHNAVVQIIEKHGIPSLGLDRKTVEAYAEAVAKEQDYVNRPLKSLHTQRLASLGRQRDALLDDVLYRLEHAWVSPDAHAQRAYGSIKREILDRYPHSVKYEAAQRKSALIGSLLMDLEQIDEAALRGLGVDAIAAELKTANDSFTQAYLARNAERSREGRGVTAVLRAGCDRLFHLICFQADYLTTRPDDVLEAIADTDERERATAQREAVRSFVLALNEHIAYFKTQYLNRHKGAAREDEADSGTEGGTTATE